MGYDQIAERYDLFVRERSYVHRVAIPALVDLCGAGERVLDLACGQGVLARALAARGHSVVGVDASAALLRIATEEERTRPLRIEYINDDACTLTSLRDRSFDGVASSLAMTDIDDLRLALLAVARVLKPGGWFAFATVHPCFNPPANYFDEGRWWPNDPDRLLARIGWHHRMLSTLLNLLLDSGFRLDRFAEPRATEAAADIPDAYREVAVVLCARAVVDSGGSSEASARPANIGPCNPAARARADA